MQGHGRIIAHDFCVAHREANSGLSTLNRTKSILSSYHQQRQLQKQRGMCLNDTYPFCQQPLSGNCHSICFSKPVLWTATAWRGFFRTNESEIKKKNPQSIESQWIADWSECRDSNSGPLEPHSSAIPNFATPGCRLRTRCPGDLFILAYPRGKCKLFLKFFRNFLKQE